MLLAIPDTDIIPPVGEAIGSIVLMGTNLADFSARNVSLKWEEQVWRQRGARERKVMRAIDES
jgi:hypothetical protein